jgi:tRNA dimethylallyltransferase
MILLLGPTASGKSALAMALAERLPLEIVSVDSAQVYRGLDIGTAKPSGEERARVPHHLIDIVEPEDPYSAARFATDAAARIADIEARGRLPLLVGGTMLYAKALIEGLHDLPPADPGLRLALEQEAASLGWPALHRRLAVIDPETAARLAPHDAQRIQRALEIHRSTGRPLSDWLAEGRRQNAMGAQRARTVTVIALEPSDRAVLHRRIEARFRTMIGQGLIEEVRLLRERPGLPPDCPAMRSVGYRQVREWLDAGTPDPLERLIERGVAATRQLAKRQLTWLRSMTGRQVIDCLATDGAQQLEARVRAARASEDEGHAIPADRCASPGS